MSSGGAATGHHGVHPPRSWPRLAPTMVGSQKVKTDMMSALTPFKHFLFMLQGCFGALCSPATYIRNVKAELASCLFSPRLSTFSSRVYCDGFFYLFVLQTLERKITEWKLQVEEHKHQILTVKETSEQKKNALKKATRAQKQRAERFEAAVESLTSKIREREVRLSETLSASSVWKSHHEKVVEEKTNLEVQIDTLKKQISNLLEELKKIQDCGRNSNKENLTKLNFVNSENEDIRLENAELKTSLATLEDNTISAEVELLDLQAKAKQQENLIQQKLEEMEVQNAELTHHLENQEVSLQRSESQLKQKLAEYEALTRQLEAALEEGRKKVSEEVGKMSSKEQALQLKILDLETELRERKEEQKKLASSLFNSEKHHEFSLKELEHSLQKSENQNQSIQNYVQFLKTTYVAMFGLKSLI
uniref:Outer dense fiber of sperm tails 2 like n=1 Tax=Sphenodon punctatus TaxID=8508 RepID=A0A8D0HMM7_SPHPU